MLNRYKITKCQFTINTSTSYSCARITSPITFDNFGHVNPNGLYDLRLGPLNITQTCLTCNQNIVKCPSHFGHIELKMPVLNPLTLDILVLTLNSICTNCHLFRHDLASLTGFISHQCKIDITGLDSFNELNTYLTHNKYTIEINSVIEFLKESALKCAHCNVKILKFKIDKTKTVSQKKVLCVEYLFNLIQNAYKKCKEIFQLLFNYEFDPRNFFLFSLPVLPNKFRPVNVINGRVYENGINSTYVKILKLNESSDIKKVKINDLSDTNEKKSNANDMNEIKNNTSDTNERKNNLNDINEKGNKGTRNMKYINEKGNQSTDIDGFGNERRTSKLKTRHKNNLDDLSKIEEYQQTFEISNDETSDPKESNLEPKNIQHTSTHRNFEGYIIDPAYLNTYILLQRYVYLIFDSSIKSKNEMATGIKQILEKKDGLFRKNMMGKRVNHSARSVISPDPNLHTREIGIPDIFASKFTYPERITNYNIEKYRNEVNQRRIPKMTINNVTYDTSFLTDMKLYELSCKLNCESVVYRTMRDNDVVLVNRQPTLHKPSIMAHRVKVLRNEKTIRMHYANCNSYNADFDGDEMNIHFLQDELSRAEAYLLMSTDHNYCLESPVRGLVQDHISVSVRACKSFFYDISMFIIEANTTKVNKCRFDNFLKHEAGKETEEDDDVDSTYFIPKPCILRPVRLYTGLQIFTSILKSMNLDINFTSKSKLDNSEVIIRDGYFLKGIIDKNQIGPTKDGLIHYCGLKYGMSVCNELLTTFGRVMNKLMINDGFSARIDDLLLVDKGNQNRRTNIEEGKNNGLLTGLNELCLKASEKQTHNGWSVINDCKHIHSKEQAEKTNKSKNAVSDYRPNVFDNKMNKTIDEQLEKDNDKCVKPKIIYKTKNPYYFKDSNIIAHLDSITKKEMNKTTSSIISSITDNQKKRTNSFTTMILSGAKGSLVNLGQISGLLGQQELEGKRPPLMESNTTLPSVESNSLNPEDYGFIFDRFADGINSNSYFFHCMAGREGLIDTAVKTARSGYLQRCLVKTLEDCRVENDLSVRMNGQIVQFLYGEDGIDPVQYNSYQDGLTCEGKTIQDNRPSLVTPGEAVGIIAAQSVGEPSTQMTLNTFHLAGVGSKNVTLGIPRLVEILMVAQKNIKTPYITVDLKSDFDLSKVQRVTLNDVVTNISIEERVNEYKIEIKTERPVSKSVIKRIVNLLDKLSKKKKIAGIEEKEEIVENEDTPVEESDSSSEALSDVEEDNKEKTHEKEDEDSEANGDSEPDENGIEGVKQESVDPLIEEDEIKEACDDSKKDNTTRCLSFTYFSSQKNILILPYLEKIMPLIIIKQWPGIKNATIIDNKLTIEGSDLSALVDLLSPEELNTMYTNDIYYISQYLGIEAARNAIIEEITNVFDVYGITINIRHLMLIADLMTRDGYYKPCSRNGMKDKSIIQRMCFESCYSYLKKGAIFNETDYVNNVSSELVLGRNVSMGTQGCFDLMYEFPDE